MSVTFTQNNTVAHLTNGSVSYVLEVVYGKYLAHRYFGRAIRDYNGGSRGIPYKHGFSLELYGGEIGEYPDEFPWELPVRDAGDYRIPAIEVRGDKLGVSHCEPYFESWEELPGKPELEGLPSTRAAEGEATTLHVTLLDALLGVRVHLYYTLYLEKDVLTRSMLVENCGEQKLSVGVAMFNAQKGVQYFGPRMAVATLSALPLVIMFLFLQKYIVASVAMAGIKQ